MGRRAGCRVLGIAIVGAAILVAPPASAGGLFLPGAGAVSTSRAGASVASTDDGEALSINPAGLAKTRGTTLTISAAFIAYAMRFKRAGTYDEIDDEDLPYEGEPYPWVENHPDLPAAIGPFQPIPVFTIASDLGGRIPGLVVAAGLYSQNTYPFRDMSGGFELAGDPEAPPPPTRYDILESSGLIAFPSIAVAYSPLPQLDIGARVSWGIARIRTKAALWGYPGNFVEAVSRDAVASGEVADNFIPTAGVGVLYRPRREFEIGAAFNLHAPIHATGDGTFVLGPKVGIGDMTLLIGPNAPESARCRPGELGTFSRLNACVDYQLPMNASLGARYKFLDGQGRVRGDIELDVGWENWGKRCSEVEFAGGCTSSGQLRLVVDAAGYLPDPNGVPQIAIDAKPVIVEHRFVDTYSVRLGGSFVVSGADGGAADSSVILRGGIGLDTRAAEDGWLRVDIDGAGRFMTAIGAAYRAAHYELSLGGGIILPTSNTNAGDCNPMPSGANARPGCGPNGEQQPIEDRRGPDPIDPLVVSAQQAESPISQGRFDARYTMFMLGVTTWF
jgi:hypothetical protein